MKLHSYIALIIITALCSGCPSVNYKSNLKKVQENNMDFPDLRVEHYHNIQFMLSSLFDNGYEALYTIQKKAKIKVIYDMDLNFSVEVFSKSEAKSIQFAFDSDTEISLLNAVHDYYIQEREASLLNSTVSIKKPLAKPMKYPGFIQVASGESFSSASPSSYFTATIEVDDEFYVFQMIGKKENMGYLYDDFLNILYSVTV